MTTEKMGVSYAKIRETSIILPRWVPRENNSSKDNTAAVDGKEINGFFSERSANNWYETVIN